MNTPDVMPKSHNQFLLSAEENKEFRRLILAWYDQQKRDLPWRDQSDWYAVVVSEFMLQQTQVKTVLPKFRRWMNRFPDVSTLANATEEDVLKEWEGLGYYSRARNLHKTAQKLAAEFNGEPPRDASEWLSFPGIGPYTAAAIASIAFNDAKAVVDGNVVRVLSRISNDSREWIAADAVKFYQPTAQSLLEKKRPGDFNQAMMELGATCCLPQKPQCLICPLRGLCRGALSGNPELLPRIKKRATVEREVDRILVLDTGRLLLNRYPSDAKRLANCFELPTVSQLVVSKSNLDFVQTFTRGISNERIRENIYLLKRGEADFKKDNPEGALQWVSMEEFTTIRLSGPHRRWLEKLGLTDCGQQAFVSRLSS